MWVKLLTLLGTSCALISYAKVGRDPTTEPIRTAVPQGKLLDFCVLSFTG